MVVTDGVGGASAEVRLGGAAPKLSFGAPEEEEEVLEWASSERKCDWSMGQSCAVRVQPRRVGRATGHRRSRTDCDKLDGDCSNSNQTRVVHATTLPPSRPPCPVGR